MSIVAEGCTAKNKEEEGKRVLSRVEGVGKDRESVLSVGGSKSPSRKNDFCLSSNPNASKTRLNLIEIVFVSPFIIFLKLPLYPRQQSVINND